ncbi:MAG: polysaccharide pyruvyl transferase family protein [Actinomycetota bacterium]
MKTLLLAGPFAPEHPGHRSTVAAFRAALPGWEHLVTAAGGPVVRPDRLTPVDPSGPGLRRAIGRSDALVVTGGKPIATPHDGGDASPSLGALTAASLLAPRTPVAMVGVGAGPLERRRDRVAASALVRRADLVVLRDEEAARQLADDGLPTPFRVGSDPSWAALGMDRSSALSGDGILVVPDASSDPESIADLLTATLMLAATSGVAIRLQPWDGDDVGAEVAVRVAGGLGGSVEILPPPVDLRDARRDMAAHRVVVSMKFHGLIAAASAGIPCVAVSHDPEVVGLATRLNYRCVTPEASPQAIGDVVLSALRDQSRPSPGAVMEQIHAAREELRLLNLLLARGDVDEDNSDGLRLAPTPWAPWTR